MQTTNPNTYASNATASDQISEKKHVPLTYIRAARGKEGPGFVVCSEHGEVLACFSSYESAFFTARQFRLTPLSLH